MNTPHTNDDQPYTTDCDTCGASHVHDNLNDATDYADNHPHTVNLEEVAR